MNAKAWTFASLRSRTHLTPVVLATAGLVTLAARPAAAADVDILPAAVADANGPGPMQIHGFASEGYLYSTDNNYFAKSSHGSFEFAELGINFTQPLSDNFRAGLQLFTRQLGPTGTFAVRADWFYLDYRWRDWLGFRAGRVKLPFGLYNDVSDIDAARVPILLPQSVYPLANRDYLLAATGGEIYGYLDFDDFGSVDYRAYGGSIFIQLPPATPGSPLDFTSIDNPYTFGGRLMWNTPIDGLRTGGSVQVLRLDIDYIPVAMPAITLESKAPVTIWVASAEYAKDDVLFATEYSRWHVKTENPEASHIPDASSTSERGYVMFSYRANKWVQPGAYYSLYFPDVDQRTGRAARQEDIAATLRFDVNEHWIVKVEAHKMAGTANLQPGLNDNKAKNTLVPEWGLFMVKTTAHF